MKGPETWVLVADASRARLLRADRAARCVHLIREEEHAASRAKAGELMADRQGRSLDSSHTGSRHAMEPDTAPKRVEKRRFAALLMDELDAAAASGGFDELVLVAEPRMLGELRKVLSDRVAARVGREVAKDLAGLEGPLLEKRLVELVWS
jgi:protein required for attachment to host cells